MRCKIEGEVTVDVDQYLRLLGQSTPAANTSISSNSNELRIALRAVQLYASRHPRPPHVTMIQAGEMLGLSRHTISKMVKTGQFRLNRCGLIPIEQVDAVLTCN